jgi:hypothetical protein
LIRYHIIINQLFDNLSLCITNGYHQIFIMTYLKTIFFDNDIDNLFGPKSSYKKLFIYICKLIITIYIYFKNIVSREISPKFVL